jgi:hypothetical protein
MKSRIPWLLAAAAAANLGLALAVWTRQPWVGGPAEWRWEYLEGGANAGAGATGGALALAAVLASLAGLAVLGSSRGAAAWRGALPLALACGMGFTFGLVAWQPGGFSREMAALVSRDSFGYVWDSALAPPSAALLADYPRASAGLNQHSVTHPPGPILLVRALDAIGGADAGGAAGGSLTGLAAAAIQHEVQQARRHGRPVPPQPPRPATVAALAVLLPALSVLAAWPLFGLAISWGCARGEAILGVLLWMLVPARSLFTPSLDQAVPVLAVGAAWLAARGGRSRAVAAGILLFGACFVSYGSFTLIPLVAAAALTRAPSEGAGGTGAPGIGAAAVWQAWAAMALGFGLPYLLLAVLAGHDPWHAMRAALALHHLIAVAPRSYLTWLLWNPYDFALLLSPAVLGLAAAAAVRRPAAAHGGWAGQPWRIAVLAWWCTLALLLLAGGVRGEAGRIWLPWMPFACLFAATVTWPWREHGERGWAAAGVLLASQAALIGALAARLAFVN